MSKSGTAAKSPVHHPNLQALLESVPGQYLILLPDFTMIEASDAYLIATMKRREQIIGHNLFEVFPDNPLDIAARGMDNLRVSLNYVLKHAVPHLMDVQKYDMRTPSGQVEERYWSLYNKPVFNSKDELIYIIHRVEDITRQVQADLKVKAGEELISLIIDNVKEYALFMLDAKGNITSWNRGAQHIKGYRASEIIGKYVSVFYTDEDIRKGTPEQNLKLAKARGKLETEGWRKKKDGSRFWAEVVLTTLYNDDGNVRAISKITRDITERNKDKEQIKELNATLEQRVIERTAQLQESEKKYHNLFQYNPMPMWLIDEETFQFLDVNEAAIKDYGYSRKKFLSMSALDLCAQNEKEPFIMANRTEDSGPLNVGIWKHFKKDGTLMYVESIIHQTTFEGKHALLVLSNDVTERKIAELHRNKITSDLIQRNKDLEQFAYILSHNLRLPVANILGFSETLLDPALDLSDVTEIAKGINASTQRLDEVILDLYNILKARSGIIEKKESVKFSELVDDIRRSLDAQIKKDHIEFTVDFSETDEINTLKSYLHSILYNLISNSIKYRKANDTCSIEIRTKKHASGITLLIKDNGIGMDLNKIKNNLFGLYKRFHREIEGRGVGLFMVKTQVEALHGTISAESEPNVGTEFTIDFKSTD